MRKSKMQVRSAVDDPLALADHGPPSYAAACGLDRERYKPHNSAEGLRMNISYKTSRPIYVGRNSHSTEDIKGRADAGGARAYKLIVPVSFHKVHANQYIKINAVDRRMNGPGASVREGAVRLAVPHRMHLAELLLA